MVLLHKKGADCEKETVNNAEEESCLRASEMLLSKKHNFQGYEAITEELEIPVSAVCNIIEKLQS